MFKNPRRSRQARNFAANLPKILDLKSSCEQIFSRKLSLGAPVSLWTQPIGFQVYLPRHQIPQTSPSITSNLPQMNLFGQDPYPVPCCMRESLKKDIADMIKMGAIRETDSPYASPVVVVNKKDNTN